MKEFEQYYYPRTLGSFKLHLAHIVLTPTCFSHKYILLKISNIYISTLSSATDREFELLLEKIWMQLHSFQNIFDYFFILSES